MKKKINNEKNVSLLDVQIETGKTHQIRAHLAHIGLPILGDGKYGINKINKSYNLSQQQLSSYSIKFKIQPQSALYYLNTQTFKQSQLPFANLF